MSYRCLLLTLPTCWLCLLPALLLPGCDGTATSSTPSLAEEVDAYVQPYLDLGFFDGAVLVARGGEVLVRQAYGMADYAQQFPNTPDGQFRIASVSKPFTKMALARLWEEGRFDLLTTIDAFVPDLPGADQITIEHLFQEQSGLPHLNDLPWYDQFERHTYTPADLVDRLKEEPLAFEPGTQTAYSNGAYALMAFLIEQVSGQSYGAYVEDAVLTPLGLTRSGHDQAGLGLPRRVTGHLPGIARIDERTPAPYVEMSLKVGGGSLYATLDDLYRWDRALFQDNVLQRTTYERLFSAANGTLAFSGRQPGFNAYVLRHVSDDVTVILLSNNYASGMLMEMAEAFAAMARGQAYDPPLVQADVTVDTDVLAAYTGRYQVPDGSVVELRLDGAHLVAYDGGEPQELLVPVADDRFILRVTWAELTFVRQPDGTVSSVRVRFLVNDETTSLPRIP